jgi:electron transport complex protein RnfC
MTHVNGPSRGGVNPPDSSHVSRQRAIANAVVPSVAVIPMLQHVGRPARCVVKPGDPVREGMLIGRADGIFSANVHASIPGRVVEVRPFVSLDGATCDAVVIELGGEFDRSGKPGTIHRWDGLSKIDLLGRIQSAGVVGLGGELVPTHLKLAGKPGKAVSSLVANGVDCEPSLSADYALMREKPREIAEGMRICRALVGTARLVLALGEDAEELVPEFERAFRKSDMECEIALMPARYPQGHEQLILSSLDGAEVPSESPSTSVVLNVATLVAVYEAVVLGKPLMERVLTVTGAPVAEPGNLKARLGTRVGDLFDDCGGLMEEPGKIVIGGPMRGIAVDSLDVPLTKGTLGVTAFAGAEARVRKEWPCIHCGSCVEVCPWHLVPTRLYKLIQRGNIGAAMSEGLARCTECGCCSFACPSHIPLAEIMRTGKRQKKRGTNG